MKEGRELTGINRRQILQMAASGMGIGTVGSAAGASDDSFVDILGTDPSEYPTVGLTVDVDTNAGRDGKLTKDDFTVYEGGELRPITEFEFSSTALDLVFVFDDSASMGGEIATMKREVKSLTDQIAASDIDARYGLVSFRDTVDTDLELTGDSGSLKSAIDSLSAGGGGDFPEDNFDAINTALDLGFRDSAQKVVVDITDAVSHHEGDGSGYSSTTLSRVASNLRTRGVTFVGVSPGYDDPEAALKVLAQQTAGLWVDINEADFGVILKRITKVLVSTYVLKYESKTSPGSVGQVSASVTDPNRGTADTTASVSVPADAGPEIPTAFTERQSDKLDLAGRVDENALGLLDDTGMVSPVLGALRDGVLSNDIDGSTAVSGVKRLQFGERVTDGVLAGAGPGSSEYAADTNLANATAKSAVNPMIELLFAGLSIVRAARYLPFVSGYAKRASRWIADVVATAAGKISTRLEVMIRAQGEDAGFALLGEAERQAKKRGKPMAEESFEDARGKQSEILIEDNNDVLFSDYLFNDEYDWHGNPTKPLDESLSNLVDGVDPDPSFTGSDDAAQSASEAAVEDVKLIQETTVDAIGDFKSILKVVGILSSILTAAAIGAALTGIGSPVAVVLSAAAGLLGLGVTVPLTMASWGLGVNGLLQTRFRHQTAVQEILHPDGGA